MNGCPFNWQAYLKQSRLSGRRYTRCGFMRYDGNLYGIPLKLSNASAIPLLEAGKPYVAIHWERDQNFARTR